MNFLQLLLQIVENSLNLRTSIERIMTSESREVTGNGTEKNFVTCPFCEQKLFNVVSLDGKAEVVVKCRRCHRFIKVRLAP